MIESILRILALTKKELLAILKDPRSRTVLFLPPLIQTLVFGYAATYDLTDVPYALLDRDHSAAASALVARLDGSGIFRRVATLTRDEDVRQVIDTRKALLVIQIDHNFERQLMAGQAQVQVIADGRNSNTAGTAIGYANSVVEMFNTQWRQDRALPGPAVQVVSRAWYNPNLETRWNMVPALIGTLTMLGTLVLTGLSVAREREQGTFDQLLVTPFRPAEIMAGKAIPCMMVGLAQATTILLVSQFWFRIPFAGSFLVLYAGLLLFLLAAVGLGLLVSSMSNTMQQAMLYSFVLLLPFTLLSGLTTPITGMPQWLQTATLINPLRHAIEIAHRVYLEGAGFSRLLPEFGFLAGIGVVTLSFSAWLFRHKIS